MLNDRLKIARRGAYPDVMLGRQVLINCAPKALDGGGISVGGNGCDGGDERDIYAMLLNESHWLPDETCQPYEARNHTCDAIHTCVNCMPTGDGGSSCFKVPSFLRYGISGWRQVTTRDVPSSHAKRERAMQAEILAGGPIVCNFAAIPEFDENYTAVAARHGGVFRTAANVSEDDINHDIVIGGWGTSEDGVKYWVGRNSWCAAVPARRLPASPRAPLRAPRAHAPRAPTRRARSRRRRTTRRARTRGTYWGEHGWFKIERGVNALLIEGACTAADPTYEGLDAELRGDESGGPLGLERIEKRARWSHAPRRSDAPAMWRQGSGAFVQLVAGAAVEAHDLIPPMLSGAFALALAVSAYAAGVAVTTRRLRRAHGADGGEADGLRTAILRDAQSI
jgi:hypothetical protein